MPIPVESSLLVIVLLPLGAALLQGWRKPRKSTPLSRAIISLPYGIMGVLTLLALGTVAARGQPLICPLGDWVRAPGVQVSLTLYLDTLSGLLLLATAGLGALLHGTLSSAPRAAVVSGLCASLATLFLADNLVLLFAGWLGSGLCAALLFHGFSTDANPFVKVAGRRPPATGTAGFSGSGPWATACC